MVCSPFLGEQWGIQNPPSCPACPSPGLVSLGETVTVVPNCAASSWCQRGRAQARTHRERGHPEGDPMLGWGCGRAAPAGSGAPGWAPPVSPTQTKYPALWLSEKFLALTWLGPLWLQIPFLYGTGAAVCPQPVLPVPHPRSSS